MSDVNPYAAPKSEVGDVAADSTAADIERLPVSPAWKDRFVLIAKAGGPKLPKFKDLAVFAVRANIDYYKKMVLKDNRCW